MNWRPAKSLEILRNQLNKEYPNRSKASDGMIGDVAHAKTVSDHNPNAHGVVTAFDITHDPENGVDIDKLSDALAASRDPRIKYLIANNLVLVPDDYGDWDWHPYSGADPHTSHLHISVYKDYDNTKEWEIGDMAEKANLSTIRILAHGIWGQNGLAGRQNVLTGKDDGYFKSNWVGMELTNDNIEKFFYATQAKQWRDSKDGNSLYGISKSLGELGELKSKASKAEDTSYEEVTEKLYRKKG